VVLKNGAPQPVDEEQAAKLLAHEDIAIEVDLQGGSAGQQGCTHEAKYWTCDFSKEYISVSGARGTKVARGRMAHPLRRQINGDYRS
jgi:glutamate N-acetyltransferase/amino-acid N-acetyltransferase